MKFTGERYVPEAGWPQISYEHWHRYLFAAEFVRGKSVLDIASGEGYGSAWLARSAGRVIGVEADAESVRHATVQYAAAPNLEFRLGSVCRIPIETPGALDVIVSFETIEHVGAEEQEAFGREVKRLLKPGGILLVSTPDKKVYSDAPGYQNEFHKREFYQSEFEGFLRGLFRNVHLLGQRIFPASYFWPVASGQTIRPTAEYQLAHDQGGYAPALTDAKEPMYFIAICSDAEIETPTGSVLLDVASRTEIVPRETIESQQQFVQHLHGELDATRARLQDASAGLTRAQDTAAHELDEYKAAAADLKQRLERERSRIVRLRKRNRRTARRNELLLEKLSALKELEKIQSAVTEQNGRLEELTARLDRLAEEPYERMVDEIRHTVRVLLPPGAVVAMASKGDDRLLDLAGHLAWHFPPGDGNEYAGGHPADSTEAISALEMLRARGGEFFILPAPLFWWLDHYARFAEHLAKYVMLHNSPACIVYSLAAVPKSAPESAAPQSIATAPRQEAHHKPESALPIERETAPTTPVPTDRAYQRVIEAARRVVNSIVPQEETVLVVSKGDDRLLNLAGRKAWHFPQAEGGLYAGHHPHDSAAAIAHLEALRDRGATFLLFPATAFWWLDHYEHLRRYLDSHARIAWLDEQCALYELSERRRAFAGDRQLDTVVQTMTAVTNGTTQEATTRSSPVSSTASSLAGGLRENLVTVIVPVYNAFEETKACLRSLVRHGRHPHQILLIDDCSPDERIWPLLQAYASAFDHIIAVQNEKNLGFTATVNRGCRFAPGDVILLNSDTEVTPDWLEKLCACAAEDEQVATVTPLSNAAGAFSVPINNQDNDIPAPLTPDDMATLVERVTSRVRPRVPTGNGFCMYVTRRALNQVGGFDELKFPRGYGEENDFCLRASAAGMVNLIDDATFIRHQGTASFLGSKSEHLSRGLATLNRLYPSYDAAVQHWLRNDPLDPLRDRLAAALESGSRSCGRASSDIDLADARPCLLFVVHDGGGGTRHMVEDLARGLQSDFRCLLLKSGHDAWTLLDLEDSPNASTDSEREAEFQPVRRYHFAEGWEVHKPLADDRIEVLFALCRRFPVDLVHVHHLLGNGPELIEALDRADVPVVFSFHDFYTACPTIQLLDETGTFCGGKCTSGAGDCKVVPNFFRTPLPVLKHQHVHYHRRRMEHAMRKASAFVAPSRATRDVLCEAFPFLKEAGVRVIEHGRDLPRRRTAVAPQARRPARVVCLGNLDRAKGIALIEQVMKLDRQNPSGPEFEFHFFGAHAPEFRAGDLGGIYHGRYERENLPDLLAAIQPSFAMIASAWPETFCYTLSEAWSMGLPVFASDIGTLRERVRTQGGGWLLDPADAERWYERMVQVKHDANEYKEQAAAAAEVSLRSVAAMVAEYRNLYWPLLQRDSGGPASAHPSDSQVSAAVAALSAS